MIAIVNLSCKADTIKSGQTKCSGPKPNGGDSIVLQDKIGNTLIVDAMLLGNALQALANARETTLVKYINAVMKVLDKKEEENNEKLT